MKLKLISNRKWEKYNIQTNEFHWMCYVCWKNGISTVNYSLKVPFYVVNFSKDWQAETLQSRNKTEERLKQCLYLATWLDFFFYLDIPIWTLLNPSKYISTKMCFKEYTWCNYSCFVNASYIYYWATELTAIVLKPKTCHWQGKYRLATSLPTMTILYFIILDINSLLLVINY